MEPEHSERELLRHGFRLDALDEWRRDASREVATLRKDVNDLVKADELAARLAKEMGKRRSVMFTRGERIVAGLTALVVAGCAVAGLVLQLSGGG